MDVDARYLLVPFIVSWLSVLGPRRNYLKGRAAIRHYANQPARPIWLLRRRPNFTSTYRRVSIRLAYSVLNVKAIVGAFNQEKALVGAFSMITKLRMDLRFKL